jgi:hypothetical protein
LKRAKVGGHCQPQLISERDKAIGRDRRQFGEVRHAQTLRLLPPVDEHCERAERGHEYHLHEPIVINRCSVPPKGRED